ncbi:hypothetical protein FQA39_LY14292 [Lamprigera yunnana]|nr:hypothetical protein FQA39_LY14292 [Lamprigera yunnana]
MERRMEEEDEVTPTKEIKKNPGENDVHTGGEDLEEEICGTIKTIFGGEIENLYVLLVFGGLRDLYFELWYGRFLVGKFENLYVLLVFGGLRDLYFELWYGRFLVPKFEILYALLVFGGLRDLYFELWYGRFLVPKFEILYALLVFGGLRDLYFELWYGRFLVPKFEILYALLVFGGLRDLYFELWYGRFLVPKFEILYALLVFGGLRDLYFELWYGRFLVPKFEILYALLVFGGLRDLYFELWYGRFLVPKFEILGYQLTQGPIVLLDFGHPKANQVFDRPQRNLELVVPSDINLEIAALAIQKSTYCWVKPSRKSNTERFQNKTGENPVIFTKIAPRATPFVKLTFSLLSNLFTVTRGKSNTYRLDQPQRNHVHPEGGGEQTTVSSATRCTPRPADSTPSRQSN